ncbi:D-alanyl-glycyl endopeptidase-like protein [Lotmaria passim]
MRDRRSQTYGKVPGDDASGVKPSSSSSASAAPRRGKELNVKDTALCDEYAIRLRREADDLERRRPSFWHMRCSSSALIGLLIWVVIGLVVYYSVAGNVSSANMSTSPITAEFVLPEGCRGDYCLQEGGTEAFGAVLGAHDGVYAYSNCYAHSCVSFLDFVYPIPLPPGAHTPLDDPKTTTRLMRTGMRWQCVEYARRYWMLRGTPVPAVFGSVEGAADMWDELTFVTLLDNVTTAPLFKYANGKALGHGGSAPRRGDVVIYPRDLEGKFPYGHVAVVVGVELPASPADEVAPAEGRVYLAEQNWHSSPWPGPYHNYSRWLPLRVSTASPGAPLRYTIHDDYHQIQGWMRYGDP